MKKKQTFMRIDKTLLAEIKKAKLVKGESYAEVVKRLIKKDREKK